MEIRNDLPGWLHRSTCPAFSVKENIITACNQSAEALLLEPGMDVRELLVTGAEESGHQIFSAILQRSKDLRFLGAVHLVIPAQVDHQCQQGSRMVFDSGNLFQLFHICFQHLGQTTEMIQ